jgi:hypothetical protein
MQTVIVKFGTPSRFSMFGKALSPGRCVQVVHSRHCVQICKRTQRKIWTSENEQVWVSKNPIPIKTGFFGRGLYAGPSG